ncbi:TIGR03862 family flavoprotein (plasmid) [Rhizobium grahamii]|uniref:TIGR03862 family flavoprotein n=1 Tax=Rhizobium grahamii TaxID=1120045 RepID=A0A5Q0CDW2_9HYPH|nr:MULTISPECIES: TIGR03862 family flavoprotein [Rhizobium]QFY63543.1 TIGR03862 family flavoprotein [Rhizobium grahamii]QRM51694.1 TIGR03862 family flavoprotein [Rhizobium sp. BG6]
MQKQVAIFGGGPSGLAAAEVLSELGHAVTVYEAMPTVARKFLLAGKSGLNITHSEPYERFAKRYGQSSDRLREALDEFTPEDVRDWAASLETETFAGSSGRVFPVEMKASPLLRRWLKRLEAQGVTVLTRHRWIGFAEDGFRVETPVGVVTVQCDAALLAFGGPSWPRLGSDGAWTPALADRGVGLQAFQPANCGFDVDWSPHFTDRFAGHPIKSVVARSPAGSIPGEFVVTKHGIEGSLVYAHSAALRDQLASGRSTNLWLDLAPGRSQERIARDLARQDTKASLSTRLRKGAGLDGVKVALIREAGGEESPEALSALIKDLPIRLARPRPIGEAISSAGGVDWNSIDDRYMLRALPGLFVAGEMIDWEAPTGGYLLTACFAMGRAAGRGIHAWLSEGSS